MDHIVISNTLPFWQQVREVERTLPDEVWLRPLDFNGPLVLAARRDAAETLVRNTHRVATPEEIATHQSRAKILGAVYEAEAGVAAHQRGGYIVAGLRFGGAKR